LEYPVMIAASIAGHHAGMVSASRWTSGERELAAWS
jgi:hypothetical protein